VGLVVVKVLNQFGILEGIHKVFFWNAIKEPVLVVRNKGF
jgi:hypothetical protein